MGRQTLAEAEREDKILEQIAYERWAYRTGLQNIQDYIDEISMELEPAYLLKTMLNVNDHLNGIAAQLHRALARLRKPGFRG